jgi:ribosome-binding factor A
MSLRNERVRKTLMKEIADILQKDIRDPRISGVVSILDVEISHDNSYAKVYYSIFGNEEQKEKTKAAIEQHTSKIRYEVGKRIRLRLTPELRFIYDDSIERGSKIHEIMEKISRGEL